MRGGRLWLVAGAIVVVLAAAATAPGQLGRTVVVLLLLSIPLTLSVVALLDAARRPEWVWALTRRRRLVWLLLILGGIFVTCAGIVISLVYLLRIRPELRDAESGRLRG